MSKNNKSNFLIIEDYKGTQKEDYMNIANQNKENFNRKKLEKYISKSPIINSTKFLKGEENKLKKMLFSFLKNEENQTFKTKKSPKISPKNDNKNKLSYTNYVAEDKNQIKKPLNKNYKQIKRNSKNLIKRKRNKTKKYNSEIELLNNNFTPKNCSTNKCITPKHNLKRIFSFENANMQKELKNTSPNVSSYKKSRNSYCSFNKSEKNYNSDDNQNSSKCLNSSPINENKKISVNPTFLFNKNVKKNNFYNKNNEEKNKNNSRSISLKNIKNFLVENFNFPSRRKNDNHVCISTENSTNGINSIKNLSKSDKNITQLKKNNLKIFKINKEKIKKNLIIRPDEQKNNSQHCGSSCFSNRKPRPKISNSSILSPQRFSSTKNPIKIIKKTFIENGENEELKNREIIKNKLTRKLTIINEKYRKLIHKGLIYDSFDDEESELEEMVSNNFYIDPNSKFCFIFDLILFFLTVYNSINIPYFLAKNIKECKIEHFSCFELYYWFSEIFNIIDTILGFFRAYYNFDEQLIKKSRFMIIHYIKSWFLIDLISSIPFYTIFNSYEPECTGFFNKYYSNQMHNLHYLFLCTKLFKLLKVFKNNRGYKKICRILKNHLIFQDKGALIIQIYMIILILHVGACIYIFIARNSFPNWISNTKMETNEFFEIYLTAIYCLTMTITSVGYGDITCYSFNERIFQIILLIFGIMAYSWIVSSISSYFEKYNNYLNDFREKIDILKDIKLHHPNMPNKLYIKIMQHLKYRNYNEKQNKNLIFDCLPLSLKNNLIYEMYKPIITKFTFFKNIDNIDFIVKVILAFRPVIAVKNDILVNDGDIVEEIAFVKKGVLIVQLLINFDNYEENAEKYSNMNLFNLQNTFNLEKTYTDKTTNNFSLIERITNNEKKNSFNNNSSINISFNYNKTKKISCENKNKKYIKIINIRENEHFGDVLMFSGQRSPMRVMVRSTKAELFILKKEDVVKISISYSNIWRRINKKSVYNFEQMKKSIQKIMEVFSPKTLKNTIFYNNFENENNELSINKKIEYKENDIEEKNNSLEQEDSEEKELKNIDENKKFNTMLSSSNLSDSVEDNEIEKEKEKEIKNNINKETIKEQYKSENSIIIPLKYSKFNNNDNYHSQNYQNSKNKYKISKKAKKQDENNLKKRERGYYYSAKNLINKNEYNFHLNISPIKKNNTHIRNNQKSMTTPYKKEEVNQEIYDGEKFELANVDENSDNLFTKTKFSDNLKNDKYNINDINSKSDIITDYIVEKLNHIDIISNINNINNKNSYNVISKEDNFSIESSYENFNLLSKNILINDKNLQKKMVIFLRNQMICNKPSYCITKTKNLNLDFTKTNDGNIITNTSKNIRLLINKKKSSATLSNFSFDSKNYINNSISNKLIPLYNSQKKDSHKIILNLSNDTPIKKISSKINSHLSPSKRNLRRKLTVNYSFHPLNRSKRNSENKSKKTSFKSYKSNNNLLSLINGNIMDITENLIKPEKFYRRYFNTLINNNTQSNNQNSNKNEKNRRHKSKNNFSNFAEECKFLSPKTRSKRNKSCCNKKNI